jgi:SET domain-containing protein
MMMYNNDIMQTTDRSFMLKPSTTQDGGVGVFAILDIPKDTFLAVKPRGELVGIDVKEEDIPKELLTYCIAKEGGIWHCPPEFNHMHMVWFLNHSDQPNAEKREDGYFSIVDIKAGDEILIDYNTLNEPEDKKENFYIRD